VRAVLGIVAASAVAASSMAVSGSAAGAQTATVPAISVIDVGSMIHDLEISGDSLWVTLPNQNRVAEIDPASLAERRRMLVGSQPKGIDRLEDGKLAIALDKATGYVEVDPITEGRHTVTLPLLADPETFDVAAIPGNDVLVGTFPLGNQVVRVDRDDDWSSTKVASGRHSAWSPRFGVAGETIVVGSGDSVVQRLDPDDPALPVVATSKSTDNLTGVRQLVVDPDGSRVHLGSGQVLRSTDLALIGTTSRGLPVVGDPLVSYSVQPTSISAHDKVSFAAIRQYDITACGLGATGTQAAELVDGGTAMLVAGGTRICRIQLDGRPAPQRQPGLTPRPDAPPRLVPAVSVSDLGTTIHDLEVDGSEVWATLPNQNRVAELDSRSLGERRRILVGSGPSGIDRLEDGTLAVALKGATGYAEIDPATERVRQVTAPLLDAPGTFDVAAIPGNDVLLSASGTEFSYVVRVDRDADWSSQRVASGRVMRSRPVFGLGPETVVVSEGGGHLFRLDAADPTLPIAASASRGCCRTASGLALTPDGQRLHPSSGYVARRSDLASIGFTSAGLPVFDPDDAVLHVVTNGAIRTHETETFSALRDHDLAGCGFSGASTADASAASLIEGGSAMLIASGSRLCRVQLDGDKPPAVEPRTAPPPPDAPPRTRPALSSVRIGTEVHDIEVDAGSLWLSLPDQHRLSEVDPTSLSERRRVLVGTGPRGIDRLEDGKLAVALRDGSGYVEVDTNTESLHQVVLPELNGSPALDVAAVPGNGVLVSASGYGLSRLVRVDRDEGWAARTVADDRYIRAWPKLGVGPGAVLVADDRLYRLDHDDPHLPVAVENDGLAARSLAVTTDGARAFLSRIGVVRTSDLTPIGATSEGYPVVDEEGDVVHMVTTASIRTHETATYSVVRDLDITGCGFDTWGVSPPHPDAAALVDGGRAVVIAADSILCRVQLDGGVAPPTSPNAPTVPGNTPPVRTPAVSVVELGTAIRDLEVGGGSAWLSLPSQNRVAELDPESLEERRRIRVGTGPSGMDLLEDGTLAVALHGAAGYVEVDPRTEDLHKITLPELHWPTTWDVAAIPGNRVLVASNTDSRGLGYVVSVDREDGRATRVADGTATRGLPAFGVAGGTIVVGVSYDSMYRLDGEGQELSILAKSSKSIVGGTGGLTLSSDGTRAHGDHGHVVRTGDFTQIGLTSQGHPVVDDARQLAYSVGGRTIRVHETRTFSATLELDISGCGFVAKHPDVPRIDAAQLVGDGRALLVASGTRLCRVQTDGLAAPARDPGRRTPPPDVPPKQAVAVSSLDMGSPVHAIDAEGDEVWLTLPGAHQVVEVDAPTMTEKRRVLVGTEPKGIDRLEDGKLAIAVHGARYAELDPITGLSTQVLVPLVGTPYTFDLVALQGNDVLLNASGDDGRLVRVDRDADWAATLAGNQYIGRGSSISAEGGTIVVGLGFSPRKLYRLDSEDPALPVVEADNHGDLTETRQHAIDPDGSHVQLGSGQVLRADDLTPVGVTSVGFPVHDPVRGRRYAVNANTVRVHEGTTFSLTDVYDISACGFPQHDTYPDPPVTEAELVDGGRAMVAASGGVLCRIELVSALESVVPARLLDTRAGHGTGDGLDQAVGRRAARSTYELQVAGRAGVPATADAAVLNVTSVDPSRPGHVTVFPCGTRRPLAANLAYGAGQTVGNSAISALDGNGAVCVYTEAPADLVVDVTGYVPAGGTPSAVQPARLMDSRGGASTADGLFAGSGRLRARSVHRFQAGGRGGVPAGADAAFLNVTVVDPSASGFVTVYSCDRPRPHAANLTYAAGDVRANAVFTELAADGDVCVYTERSTHLVVDVNGYTTSGDPVEAMAPARLLETRVGHPTVDGRHAGEGQRSDRSTYVLGVTGRAGIPEGARSVVLNVTAVDPSGRGFVTVFPCGKRPLAANVIYEGRDVVSGAVLADVAADGTVCLYTERSAHLVVDANAFVPAGS
jgi:hypothetical protein